MSNVASGSPVERVVDEVIPRFNKWASEAYSLATSYTLDELSFLPLPRALPLTAKARLFQFFT